MLPNAVILVSDIEKLNIKNTFLKYALGPIEFFAPCKAKCINLFCCKNSFNAVKAEIFSHCSLAM